MSHDSGPRLRSNVISLVTSSVPSTRQEWYVRVNLHIRHWLFVSKSRTASGVLCMLTTSLMRPLFRHRPRKDVLQNNMVGCAMYRHLTWSMDIINCPCERVISRLHQRALRVVCYENGWWYPKGYKTYQSHWIFWWRSVSFPIGIMHINTFLTYLSIVVPSNVGRMLITPHRSFASCSRVYAHERLYANASKWIFGAEEIPFLGCFIGKRGVRADPAKVNV